MTESEVVSLAHSLYQEGIPSLQLWELLLARPVNLRVYKDNQATILVVRKGYSSKLRHITGHTHKVNLSCLSEVFRDDSTIIEYICTGEQAADIFTKALPPHKWSAAVLLGMRIDLPLDLKSST